MRKIDTNGTKFFVTARQLLTIFLIVTTSLSLSRHSFAEEDFNRFLVSQDIYNTCQKILFDTGKNQILYSVGTSPEVVCRCSGEYVSKNMTWDEFNFIKHNSTYPDSVFEKITSSIQKCAIITSD